ncbi:MAG: phage tail tape measure protein [Polyangiaceae bacterium]
MSSALREIFASFGVEFDATKLEEGGKKVDGTVSKLRELGEAVLAAFAVEKIAEFTLSMVEQADALDHAAVATGLGTQELQAWQLGAAEADVDAQAFSVSLRKLSLALSGGGDEAGSGAKLFAELGIQTKDATGHALGLGEVLPQISEHFKNLPDGAEKAALATKLFGRQGTQLLPLLNEGAQGIVRLKTELDELGGGFSPEFIERATKVDNESKRLNQAWTSLKVTAAGALLPALNLVMSSLTKLVAWGVKLAKSSNVVQAALITMGAVGTAAAAGLVIANAPLIATFGLIAAALGIVILAVDELITTWQGGDTIITRIVDRIFGPGNTAKVVAWIKGIVTNLENMFEVLMNRPAEFEQIWSQTILNGLGPVFGRLATFWLEAAGVMFDMLTGGFQNFSEKSALIAEGVKLAFSSAWEEIQFGGLAVVATLQDAFSNFLAHLGPVTDLAKKLGIDLGEGHAVLDTVKTHNANLLTEQAQGDAIKSRLTQGKFRPNAPIWSTIGPPQAPTTNNFNTTTNVNVTGNTPGQLTREITRAAAHGASGAHRRAAAALGQGAG